MRIAIDTGGTFTDCIFLRGARLEILKVFSTPANPARAIAQAVETVRARPAESVELLHGTTVGTNALLERRGGRVALVTTAGFEDVLEIGRQARPRLYDFFVDRPAPLVPRERRFGLRERIAANARPLLRPSRAELARIGPPSAFFFLPPPPPTNRLSPAPCAAAASISFLSPMRFCPNSANTSA